LRCKDYLSDVVSKDPTYRSENNYNGAYSELQTLVDHAWLLDSSSLKRNCEKENSNKKLKRLKQEPQSEFKEDEFLVTSRKISNGDFVQSHAHFDIMYCFYFNCCIIYNQSYTPSPTACRRGWVPQKTLWCQSWYVISECDKTYWWEISFLTTLFCNGEIASEDVVQFVKETESEICGNASLIWTCSFRLGTIWYLFNSLLVLKTMGHIGVVEFLRGDEMVSRDGWRRGRTLRYTIHHANVSTSYTFVVGPCY